MENKKIMKDMNRVKVTVIGVIAALAVNFMGVDKVQAQDCLLYTSPSPRD